MRSKSLLETTKRIVATIELTLYSVKDLADMAEYRMTEKCLIKIWLLSLLIRRTLLD